MNTHENTLGNAELARKSTGCPWCWRRWCWRQAPSATKRGSRHVLSFARWQTPSATAQRSRHVRSAIECPWCWQLVFGETPSATAQWSMHVESGWWGRLHQADPLYLRQNMVLKPILKIGCENAMGLFQINCKTQWIQPATMIPSRRSMPKPQRE